MGNVGKSGPPGLYERVVQWQLIQNAHEPSRRVLASVLQPLAACRLDANGSCIAATHRGKAQESISQHSMAKLQKNAQLWVLVVVVLLDLLAVSLVVPLLPARYRELGVGAKALGFASSAYSLAQIVGGLALGALSDRSLGHRGLLLLSFVGAATAYAIVGWPGATFYTLVGSRVVVGLCKQTMTASTALVAVRTCVEFNQ